MRLPRHLAIIMDGNGRWAEQRGLPRIVGHHRGVEAVKTVVQECRSLGLDYLTLYAFSSENWGRPAEEVSALMGLLCRYLESELEPMLTRGLRLQVIGETCRLPREARRVLDQAMARTAANDGMVLTLALSYGSRDEIVRAVRSLTAEVLAGRCVPEAVDEALLSSFLDTRGLPDPDLLIRTSGEMRISNFLLWQLAYTELYFTEVLWPDFDAIELHRALEEYAGRQRRFGLTGAQVHGKQSPEEDHH
jgi:undecaprenyl diphosphate synthase